MGNSVEHVVDALQRPIMVPARAVIVDRAPGRQVPGDTGPLAARAGEIHHAIHNLTDVHRAFVATSPGRGDQGRYLIPFPVRQVMGVAKTGTVMTAAGLTGPHQPAPNVTRTP